MSTPATANVFYTNYAGVRRERHIMPISIWYGTTQWHPEPQWFIKAIDMDTAEERDFALRDFG